MQFSTDTRTADESIRPPPRRLYTNAFKLNVVRETLRPGASVSIIARRHDLNSNMLFRWRREYHQGLLRDDPQPADASSAAQFVVDVGVVNKNGGVTLLPPPKPSAQAEAKSSADGKPKDKQSSQGNAGGRIEICLKNGVTVRVSTPFDDGDLQRVLSVASGLPGERR
jgi:transposase-like protein